MSTTQAYVLEGYDILEFIQHILDNHSAPSWLVICSARKSFMTRLGESIEQPSEILDDEIVSDSQYATSYLRRSLDSRLTMRLLASCNTLRLAFTPDIVHLRAFLASLDTDPAAPVEADSQRLQPERKAIIAVLDPLSIHRPTTSYSAQGFNRTFALAIDTAYANDSNLVVCECLRTVQDLKPPEEPEANDIVDYSGDAAIATYTTTWDDEIGIVDVRTKTFGPGSRGWVGRTVKIRQVAERLMLFKQRRTS